ARTLPPRRARRDLALLPRPIAARGKRHPHRRRGSARLDPPPRYLARPHRRRTPITESAQIAPRLARTDPRLRPARDRHPEPRFQQLDSPLRGLIRALQRLQESKAANKVQHFTVDVAPGSAAAFHAEQDTWTAGPVASVDIVVQHDLHGQAQETHLKIHEVWWADVNEP